ncbi:unnamed protein product [Rangifer tarandus platyrhynchus]|uniref:Uncharacterized protein n=2 Tax=Rangifer tarandus platyrhynchus TaxID=3082113 RepID=A0ACB0EUQ5_RANTA|nr:unnamed protein product [Rangifer tarandus platyrhynchus]CAI9704537.1 unnamed protein product [Rangifer tarandus platyrhynchus]
MEGLRKTEPEGISSVTEGGRHDAEARRSKLCLGKQGDRRVGEALEEGSIGPSKPPSASFPESLQKTSSMRLCVQRSLPSWHLSVPFSDEGERAAGSPSCCQRPPDEAPTVPWPLKPPPLAACNPTVVSPSTFGAIFSEVADAKGARALLRSL